MSMMAFGGITRDALREELRPRFRFEMHPDWVIKRNDTPTVNAHAVDYPVPFYENGIYYIYYEGNGTSGHGIALAQGPTPQTLVSNPTLLLTAADISWSANYPAPGSMVKVGATYYLYFTADVSPSGYIGVATSSSPTGPFVDSGAAILIPDATDVGSPATGWLHSPYVKYYNGLFWMLYSGVPASTGIYGKIYAAVSKDGVTWNKLGRVIAPEPQRNESAFSEASMLSPDEADGKWWISIAVEPCFRSHMEAWYPATHHAWAECKLASGNSPLSIQKHGYVFSGLLPSSSRPLGVDNLDDFNLMRVGDKIQIWCGSGADSGIGFAEAEVDDFLQANWTVEPMADPPPAVHNLWRNTTIVANAQSNIVIAFGYHKKTIHFLSNMTGTLTIRVLTDEMLTFQDYDLPADEMEVTANVLKTIIMEGNVIALRLRFSQAATVSGSVIMTSD